MRPSRNVRKIMGKIKSMYLDKLESKMCNDCPNTGDIHVTFKKFPDIIVCDSCFDKYYFEKPIEKLTYR